MKKKIAYLAVLSCFTSVFAIAADADKSASPEAVVAKSAKRWSPYEVVQKPAVPAVANKSWVRSPIDAFILAQLEANNLKPSGETDRATFIRRATLDAWGCYRRRRRSRPSSMTSRRRPTKSWSTACSPRIITVSARAVAGSIWPATPTARASRMTRRGPIAGVTAITSSAPSTRTSRTTASSRNSWRATSFTRTARKPRLPPATWPITRTTPIPATWFNASTRSRPTSPTTLARPSWPRHRLRPLPQSQVRQADAEGLLLAAGFLRQYVFRLAHAAGQGLGEFLGQKIHRAEGEIRCDGQGGPRCPETDPRPVPRCRRQVPEGALPDR